MRSICFPCYKTMSVICILALLNFTGCSGKQQDLPDLAEVTGVVTLDGKPLADAIIDFYPQTAAEKGNARTSSGMTNADGQYTLMYNNDTVGAIVGDHLVRISKSDGGAEVAGPETLPAKYNNQSQLKATVGNSGVNQIDFELKSK